MVNVKYDDLEAAFHFASSAAPTEHRAYVSRDTGAIYWVSELEPLDEDVPDDLEDSDRYLEVPHKNELDLGTRLALSFAAEVLPDRYEVVEGFFRRRGAYGRFKEFLSAEGHLEKWYDYEAGCTARALKDWCTENGIQLVESAKGPTD